MLNRTLCLSLLILGSASISMMASPAVAGFQWVAPANEAAQPAPSPVPPAQAAPQAFPPPMIIQAPPAVTPPVSSQPVTRAPQTLQLPPEKKTAEPSPLTTEEHKTEEPKLAPPPSAKPEIPEKEKTVRGFANNVPLAVALRQILPSEYGFSAAQDVPLSTVVSWQGGRSWRPILEDMLKSIGLAMREQAKMIHIVRVPGSEGLLPAAAAVSPPPSTQTLQPPLEKKPVTLLTPPAGENVFPTPPAATMNFYEQQQPVAAGSAIDSWTGNRGETLRKILETWCKRHGIELSWQAEYDYPLQASVTLTGTFEEAVRSLLTGFQDAQPQPVGTLHNSAEAGQTVLVIQARGNNYSD